MIPGLHAVRDDVVRRRQVGLFVELLERTRGSCWKRATRIRHPLAVNTRSTTMSTSPLPTADRSHAIPSFGLNAFDQRTLGLLAEIEEVSAAVDGRGRRTTDGRAPRRRLAGKPGIEDTGRQAHPAPGKLGNQETQDGAFGRVAAERARSSGSLGLNRCRDRVRPSSLARRHEHTLESHSASRSRRAEARQHAPAPGKVDGECAAKWTRSSSDQQLSRRRPPPAPARNRISFAAPSAARKRQRSSCR